jgi:hypothetical protein
MQAYFTDGRRLDRYRHGRLFVITPFHHFSTAHCSCILD